MKSDRVMGYQAGTSWLHRLSATSKLLFFLLTSLTAMLTYDTRLIVAIALFSLWLVKCSGVHWREVRLVFGLMSLFASMNLVMVYLFSPQYGVGLYGQATVWWSGWGNYNLTAQQAFYLLNLFLKYLCTVPLAVVFILTTHPSQFASSLYRIGVPYKIAYAVSLTLRYIPDLQADFQVIKLAQAARGLELSHQASLSARIKGNLQLVTPLIFSSLGRIETIATAMSLRRFGQHKRRTWWCEQKLAWADWLTILAACALWLVMLGLLYLNQGRFYNPWRLG